MQTEKSLVPAISNNYLLFGIFKTEIIKQYGFSVIELFVFYMFFSWASSGTMITIIVSKITYFLFDYSSIAPIWGLSVPYLKKIMLHLSGSLPRNVSTNLKFPLIRYTANIGGKMKTYYTFDNSVMRVLIDFENIKPLRKEQIMAGLPCIFDDTEVIAISKSSHNQERKLNKNIKEIIDHLLVKDSPFHNRPPSSDYNYTDVIKHFSERVTDIYLGRFNGYGYPISDEFVRYNSSHSIEKSRNEIQKCKGDWQAVKKLIYKAARNYSTWFDPANEPMNKKFLPTELSSWIYRYDNKSSFFIASIDGPAFPVRENIASNVYNTIDPKVRTIFKKLYQADWDGVQFWSKVASISRWYDKYSDYLINIDTKATYWLAGGKYKWLEGYIEWLKNLADGESKIYLKNIGTNNNTWSFYLREAMKIHRIEADLTILK